MPEKKKGEKALDVPDIPMTREEAIRINELRKDIVSQIQTRVIRDIDTYFNTLSAKHAREIKKSKWLFRTAIIALIAYIAFDFYNTTQFEERIDQCECAAQESPEEDK